MKCLVFGLILVTSLAYGLPACTSTNTNVGGNTLGASIGLLTIGAAVSGCLTVGSSGINAASAGLDVNPSTGPSAFYTGDLTVGWTVDETSAGVYNYSYTFTNTAETISHVLLGLGTSCTTATTTAASNSCIYDITSNPGIQRCGSGTCPGANTGGTGTGTGFYSAGKESANGGNPGMPDWQTAAFQYQPSSGVNTETISFNSKIAPTWEDVYVRDTLGGASSIEGWNNTAGGFYIPTPGPEPGFYGILGLGMAGLFLALRSRRKRSSTISTI